MTLSEEIRQNLRRTNKINKKGTAPKTMLDKLMDKIEFHRKVEVVDLTSSTIVAAKLDEAKIFCLPEEKDYYLYYFLEKYKGRTLVFVNAITNIKRLIPLLQMLRIQAWPMHAAMQQRQRLKNLGAFYLSSFSIIYPFFYSEMSLELTNERTNSWLSPINQFRSIQVAPERSTCCNGRNGARFRH
jgi:ATP-dependent RNA helicase DDX24/MAK5